MFLFWCWAVDEGYSDTQARTRLSCWFGKNDKLATAHGNSNIKQILKLMVWLFCKNKGCKRVKYTNPVVVEAVKTNMALKVFLSRIGDKKIRTVSAIGKVGAGVLPAQIFFVNFLSCFERVFGEREVLDSIVTNLNPLMEEVQGQKQQKWGTYLELYTVRKDIWLLWICPQTLSFNVFCWFRIFLI